MKKSLYSDLENPVYKSIRAEFGQSLYLAAKQNPKVIGLCADLRDSLYLNLLAEKLPDQYLEMGVAEQNMLGVAAGLSFMGKIPFAASYAVFSPGRTWDQLRVSIAYSNANVKIIGSHAGLNVGPDGATHQALEDIAITRVLPNLTVIVATDAREIKKIVDAAIKHPGPIYIRFGREKSPIISLDETPFKIGKCIRYLEGDDLTICANGPLLFEALKVAEILAKSAISCDVLAVHTVKPLDEEAILTSARKTNAVLSLEEAQVIGGLGSAICELLAEHYPIPSKRIGVNDRFGQSGTATELAKFYGLSSEAILNAAQLLLKRKKSC